MKDFHKWLFSSGVVSVGVVLLVLAAATSACAQSTYTVAIDPKATYLATYDDPLAVPAVPIALSAIGLEPGQKIALSASGSVSFCTGCPLLSPALAALFSSDTTVAGALKTPIAVPATTGRTWIGSIKTNVAQDFWVPVAPDSVTVVVPSGAAYLFIILADSHYGDNNSSTLAATITTVGTADLQLGVYLANAANLPASAVVEVPQGTTLTYVYGVRNNGPDPAQKVKLVVPMPKGTTLSSAVISDALGHSASCGVKAGNVVCALSALDPSSGASASISFLLNVAPKSDTIRPLGTVSSPAVDLNSSNNTALPPTVVVAPAAVGKR